MSNTILRVRQITKFKLGCSLGCTRCLNTEKYIITVIEDNSLQPGTTFLLCETCFQDMVQQANAIPMSVN